MQQSVQQHAGASAAGTAAPGYGGFHLGGMALALPMAALREVLPCPGLQALPAAASCVAGALLVRGVLVPVLDLLRLLGRGRAEPAQCSVVLVVVGGQLLGLLVEGVSGVFAAQPGSLQALQESGAAAGLMAASLCRADDGSTVTLLSPSALLALPGVPSVADPEPERATAQAAADASFDDALAGNADTPLAQRQFMLVRCGHMALALDALAVQGTLNHPALAASVLAQGACRGVADLGGLPVAMVDLPAVCGLGELSPTEQWQAVVLRCAHGLVGLLVDEVVDVVAVATEALLPAPRFVLHQPALFEGVLPVSALAADLVQRCGVLVSEFLVLDSVALATWPELDALAEALGSRRVADDAAADMDARVPMLTFDVEGEVAVPIEQVTEILPFEFKTGVYAARHDLLGMVTLRGRCIPVVCLRQMCGLSAAVASPDASVLVVQHGEQWVGFAVPRLRSIESARHASLALPRASVDSPDGRQPLVTLGHGAGERLVPLYDLQRVAQGLIDGGMH